MGRFNRLFNYPELTVLTLGTGKTAHQLGDLMARYHPEAADQLAGIDCLNSGQTA